MISQSVDSGELAKTWDERPHIIRAFLNVRPRYDQLCSEIMYILEKRMEYNNIEYSAITGRAKTLQSFVEKLSRKHYNDPLNEVTDLAGVRLVYLYKTDQPAIEKAIEAEFEIIEKVDKLEEQEPDKFGYGALHYLVRLGRKSSGARYDDLKGIICELQVRTVLQDAWAIINHHLSYKQESDIPKHLKREIYSLSASLEATDNTFDRIRTERKKYKRKINTKLKSRSEFLSQELNLDTFTAFLHWKFPNMETGERKLSRILDALIRYDYKTLSDLDGLIQRTEKARAAISLEHKTIFASAEVARAIALEQQSYREEEEIWNNARRALFKKYENLLSNN